MNFSSSLRLKLTVFYVLILLVPLLIIAMVMPTYYQYLLSRETESLTENILESLSNNIEVYLDDLGRLTIIPYLNNDIMFAVNQITNHHYKNADPYTQFMIDKALYDTLPKTLQNTRKEILGTILVTMDGSAFINTTNGGVARSHYPFTRQDWFQKALQANGKVVFIPSHPEDYIDTPAAKEVFSVARLIKDPTTLQPLAVIMADADASVFDKLIRRINFNTNSIIAIMDDKNHVLYSNTPMPGTIKNQLNKHLTTVRDTNDTYLVVSKKIIPANWKIVVLLSNAALRAKVRWMYIAGILFACCVLLITVLLFFYLSRWITRPYRNILHVMRQVQQGNLQVQVQTSGTDEIAQLGHTFNAMLERINELIDREYRSVLNQRNAEYRALQSQIHPHFLYNTLNGLIGLNRLGCKEELEKAIFSLSSMLRYTLEQAETSTVAEEFSFLKRYCDLQKMRFQDRMEYHIHMEGQAANYEIPKLLLQPLVENSIIHGIEPSDQPCTVSITAEIEQIGSVNMLRITIADDGIGFDLEPSSKSTRIGISNVRERLHLYHSESTFAIHSKSGEGTQVTIQIPVKDVSQ